LANRGITGIKAHYDGGGDSGYIEEIVGYSEKDLDLETLEDRSMWAQVDYVSLKNESLIEDFVYSMVEDIEDWWNNEGGYGYINILVPSGEYSIENFIRRTETDCYNHTGNLIENKKSKD
jgi:hypothetical protein